MAPDAPADSPVPPSFIPLAVLPIAAVLLISLRPPNLLLRSAAFFGVAASLFQANQLIRGDDVLARYSLGSFIGGTGGLAWWFLFVLPSENVQFLTDHAPVTSLPASKRFLRLLYLWVSPRNIGWHPQTPNLPPSPGPSRAAFLARRVGHTVMTYLVMDISYAVMRLDPAVFLYTGAEKLDMGGRGFALRCLYVVIQVCYTAATLNIQYCIMSLLLVALHLGEPQYWPNLIGSITDAYTIRRFWNRFWHQMLRKIISPAGKSVARMLGFSKGSSASSRVQLLVAFLFSGLTHVPGDMAVGYEFVGCSLPFFAAQAIGVMVEDELVAVGKRAFPQLVGSRFARTVGYAWTLAWFAWTWPLLVDWHLRVGSGKSVGVPFSVVDRALGLVGISI